ncbi:glycosyltransferase family 1 protein [Ramlibacter solisilvae]|uniref:glycosyltransferase n=1 Tax=Ramlibacter tataouinensis TaxID=94132 RepID=UPI000777210D|nr:glycosyltransferase [Ramlibacter tataouinensis]
MKSLVVFSHLRWDFVQRRPQHLLSRLARRWRVIYIEEPLAGSSRNGLEVIDVAEGVQVWRPQVTGAAPGFHDDHLPVLQKLIAEALHDKGIADYWAWMYTPMALSLATAIGPRGLVYDCVEDLSTCKDAPRQLVLRENLLFKLADLVFAGGHSIYNAKRHRHPEVHCFPNGVDAAHFAGNRAEHPLQAAIAHPRLGYCGVIDAHINLELIDAIAKGRADWNLVMAGPTAGIEPAALPRRDNIHWLGRQEYADLPALIAGWDVCLLPYSLDDATHFINPGKTLEYMACGRPVVSTSIRDVVEAYGQVVRIADTPEGFIADCDMIMQRTAAERQEHARALAEIVARSSWEATADEMAELIAQADDLVDDGGAFARPTPLTDAAQTLPQRAPARAGA